MESILTIILAIDWIANDVHYATDTNQNFYARHLLSDRVRDFGSAEDDIKEVYYLGYKGEQPPSDLDISAYAINLIHGLKAKTSIERLIEVMDILVSEVESAKAEKNLPGGIHAILDDVSKRALTYLFLLKKENGSNGAAAN